ncbi:MAG TPA: hypothetical protein VM032_16555, partial [Vicinamibacterales bacterium]|nr:hypothetical protein [Vicinamibacterales bacterium]
TAQPCLPWNTRRSVLRASVISADSFVTMGAGLVIGGGVAFGWWHSWGTFQELRADWRDFRAAANDARANARERRSFASGRSCSRCHVALNARRLFRAVNRESAATPGAQWVYRCRCGESTLYDGDGEGHHLEPASAA